MASNDTANQLYNEVEIEEKSLSIQEFFDLCVKHWRWFVTSALIFSSIAVLYVLSTPKNYTRTAAIMIKEDSGAGGGLNMGSMLGDLGLGLFQSSSNVYNELVSITSPVVFMEVIKEMNLDVDYKTRKFMRMETLYRSTLPWIVEFPEMSPYAAAELKIDYHGDGTATLMDFSMSENEEKLKFDDKIDINIMSADTINDSPIGTLIVRPNPEYTGKTDEPIRIDVKRTQPVVVLEELQKTVKPEIIEERSTVIHLTYEDVSRQRAEDLLSTIIDVYKRNWINEENAIAVATSHFIDDRLNVIVKELHLVDDEVADFKTRNMLPDIQAQSELMLSQVAKTNESLLETSNMLAMAKFVRDYLVDNDNNHTVLPANTGLKDADVQTQIAEYNKALLQRNVLAKNSSERNPLVIDMDSQLTGMRQSVQKTLESYILTLEASLKNIQRTEASNNKLISSAPSQARDLISIERQQKVKEALYLFLLQKREENELTQTFAATNTRIIAPPSGPLKHTSPRGTILVAMSFFLGLLFPALYIYLSEMFNNTVRSRKDIEVLSMPFIGEIPLNNAVRKNILKRIFSRKNYDDTAARDRVVGPKQYDTLNEAFRVVRTNLELMSELGNRKIRSIMITSAAPGSGKTFVSLNLASVLAIKNKHVILVDLDLRKATLSASVANPQKGIVNYLVGQNEIDSLITHKVDGLDSLDMLPVGIIPPNPSELLAGERLNSLFKTLEETYDYVIIDCPPVEMVADSQIINRYVDMTIFVIRAGLMRRDMLPAVQNLVTTGRFHDVTILLNGSENGSGGHGSYGYGYGYGHKK